MFQVITHASEVLTGAGIRAKDGRKVTDDDLGRILDGALVLSVKTVRGKVIPQRIEWVGPTSQLPKRFSKIRATNLKGKRAIIPGLVDCHTHLVFAGDRSEDFAERCAGVSYQEIARKGGGIARTVRATQLASEAELLKSAELRAREMFAFGVRTLEIKSGYGLTLEDELKILRVAAQLKRKLPEMHIHSTFLGAHDFPPGIDRACKESRKDSIRQIVDVMLPEVKRLGLADSCDVFVDDGYFTLREGQHILTRAKQLGFSLKLHADELSNTESTRLAVKMAALSADHLLQVSLSGIRALAKSRKTVAVLLPGTAFYLKADHAPARKLIQAGACVALATDFNPGSSMCASLPAIMTIAALYLQMTRAEIFAAVTYNGAKALGCEDRLGTLEVGNLASFAILPFPKFEELYYRFAWSAGR